MLTPRENSPLPEKFSPEEDRTRDAASSRTASPTHFQRAIPAPSTENQAERPSVCLLVGCLTSQQHASVSQGRICTDNFTCCHTDREAADQTPTSPSHSILTPGPPVPALTHKTPGAWQGSHWSANFEATGMTRPRKNPGASGIRTRDLPLSRRKP